MHSMHSMHACHQTNTQHDLCSMSLYCRAAVMCYWRSQDIVRYIVRHFGPTALGDCKDFWNLVVEESRFAQQTVEDLMQVNSN